MTDTSAEDADSESTDAVTETASYTASSDTRVTVVTVDGSGDEADAADEEDMDAETADGETSDEDSADSGASGSASEVLYCASAPDGSDVDDEILYVEELTVPQYASDSSTSDEETYQDFTYSTSGGEASITGYVGDETEIVIPDTITAMGDSGAETFTVTSIAANAFYQNTTLTKVTLSDNVVTIGNYAFYQCTALETVVLSENLTTIGQYAFRLCESLESIVIPESVTSIGEGAFRSCTALKSADIQAQITVIYTYTFAYCSSLESVTIPDTVTDIKRLAFEDCSSLDNVVLPEGITSLGEYAFRGCTSLTSIILPDTITSLADSCFSSCTSLASVTISAGLTTIKGATFQNCTSLTEIVIPANVTAITGEYAFRGCTSLERVEFEGTALTSMGSYIFGDCTSLTEVILPSEQTFLGDYMFYGCTALTEIDIPNTVTSIGTGTFQGCTGFAEFVFPESLVTIGSSAFYGCTSLTKITLPDSVASIGSLAFTNCSSLADVNLPEGLTSIGSRAFAYCTAIEEITIPESVTSLDSSAFSHCTALAGITIPKSITALSDSVFTYCTALAEVNLPDTLTEIGSNAFSYCTSLTEMTMPDTVTSIGDSAFRGCSSLTEILLSANLESIGISAFRYCTALAEITLPDTLTSLGNYAFSGCTALTEVTVPGSVTSVGSYIFEGCTGLEKAVLCEGITTVGRYMFENCTALISAEIPESVTAIEGSAFYKCSSLSEITLPSRVESIGAYAFQGCTGIKEFTLPDTLTSTGNRAFDSCTGITEITIPDSLTDIGSYVFANCTGLVKATLPSDMASIPTGMFDGCTSLTEITIPETVTEVGFSAFDHCSSLTQVVIPDSVTSMGNYAFYYCTGLTDVEVSENLSSLGNYVFRGCSSLDELLVPDSLESIGTGAFPTHSKFVLSVYPGSYAYEYAVSNSVAYKLLADCSLTVEFDGIDSWSDYAGRLLVAASDDVKVSKRISTATSYVLTGLISGEEYTVAVTNAYGDVISSQAVELVKGENEVTFTELAAIADVAAHVYDADGNEVTDEVTVTWTEDGTAYAVSSSLVAVPVGTALSCEIRLSKALAMQYETPDAATCTVTEDGAQVNITLSAFQTVTLTGTVVNESGEAVSGAAVAATQKPNGYTNSVTALSGSDGTFALTVYASDTQLKITAGGYGTVETEVSSPTGNVDLGMIALEALSGPKISLQVTYQYAAKSGATATSKTLYSFSDVAFTIENQTTGSEVTEYSISGKTLVLGSGAASAGDKLKITLSSLTDDFDPVSVTVTVGSDEKATATASLTQRGSIYVTWESVSAGEETADDTSEDGTAIGFVYDASGKQVYKTTSSVLRFSTDELPAGTYTVILAGYSEDFVYPQTLSAWQSLGLASGTDYVAETVTVTDGVITELSFEEVPAFDVESFSYLDLQQSSFTSSKTSVTTGTYVTLRAKAVLKEEYAEQATDFKWILEISENSSFLAGTLSVSGQSDVESVQEGNVLEISVDDPSAMTRFCVLLTETGDANAAAYLEFTIDGVTYRQAVGTLTVTCTGLDFTMIERTNLTAVPVSGTGTRGSTVKLYDDGTLVGQTEVSLSGSWSMTFEIYRPYTYTTHEVYAELTTADGITYRTETKQLIYQYAEDPISVSRVTMVNYNIREYQTVFTFDGLQTGQSASYSYNPSYPEFTFLIEFNGEDLSVLSNVQLTVACSNGESVTLDAEYDETQGCYVATRKFYSSALPTGVSVRYDAEQELIFSDEEMEAWEESVEAMQEDLDEIAELGNDIDSLAASGDEDALACQDAKEAYEEALEEWQDALEGCYGEVTETEDGFVIQTDCVTITNTVNYSSSDLSGCTGYRTTGGNTVYVSASESSLVMISGGSMTTVSVDGDLDSAVSSMKEALDRLSGSADALSGAAGDYSSAAANGDYAKLAGELLDFITDFIPFVGELKAIEKQLEDFDKLDGIWAEGNCAIRKECNYYKAVGAAYIAGQVISMGAEVAGAEISPLIAAANYAAGKLYDNMNENNLKRLAKEAESVPAGCDCGQSGCLCGCGCDVCPGGEHEPESEGLYFVPADNTSKGMIDPSGYVYEAVLSNRLEGVTATIYQKETLYDIYDEAYEQITLWDAAEYGQENPLTTNSEGEYAWDVPEGLWSVVYEKEGYVTEQSDWMEVPPPQLDINVGLVSYEAPVLEKVLAYTDGVEITFSKYMQTETLTAENITVKVNGTAVEGTFVMANEEENPEDTSETFTSVVTFVPTEAIATGATVTVEVSDAAVSYAGTAFAGEAVTAETVLRPDSFTADESASVVSGETVEVTIQALPAEAVAGVTVAVANQTSLLFTVEETEVTLDAEGRATVHVTGSIAGESVIIFTLGDTGLTAETVVSVSMAAPSITRSEVSAGNIDASLITAIAGSRDAEQISFAGSYDLSDGLTLTAKSGVTGDKALLLQEDDSAGSGLVLIDFCMIDSDGNITFTVEEAVDSVIVYGTNGDVTGDGVVNASDTLAILRGVSGRTALDAVEEGFADVNLDGVVNSNDLLAVVKYVSGRTSSLN